MRSGELKLAITADNHTRNNVYLPGVLHQRRVAEPLASAEFEPSSRREEAITHYLGSTANSMSDLVTQYYQNRNTYIRPPSERIFFSCYIVEWWVFEALRYMTCDALWP